MNFQLIRIFVVGIILLSYGDLCAQANKKLIGKWVLHKYGDRSEVSDSDTLIFKESTFEEKFDTYSINGTYNFREKELEYRNIISSAIPDKFNDEVKKVRLSGSNLILYEDIIKKGDSILMMRYHAIKKKEPNEFPESKTGEIKLYFRKVK